MFVSFGCCELSGRRQCVGLITRLEGSYRVCVCVCVCLSVMVKPYNKEQAMTPNGVAAPQKKKSMNTKLLRPYIMEDQVESCSLVY